MGKVDSSFVITSVEKQENGLRATVTLDDKNALFEGHFPNDPIMPGVLNIEIIENLLKEKMDKTIKQINQIKFLKPVIPNSNEPLEYELVVSVKPDNRTVASIKGFTCDNLFVKIQLEIA